MIRLTLAALLLAAPAAFAEDLAPVEPAPAEAAATQPATEPQGGESAEKKDTPRHRCAANVGSRLKRDCKAGGITREDIERSGRTTIAPPLRTPAPAGR